MGHMNIMSGIYKYSNIQITLFYMNMRLGLALTLKEEHNLWKHFTEIFKKDVT